MLEKCLIVDNFNQDLDMSLQSFIEHDKEREAGREVLRDENRFFSEEGREQCSETNIQLPASAVHKRKETVIRQHVMAFPVNKVSSTGAEKFVSFAKTTSLGHDHHFGCSLQEGSSSETTTRNLRYFQKEESSQNLTLSRDFPSFDHPSKHSEPLHARKKDSFADATNNSVDEPSDFFLFATIGKQK